MNTETIQLSMTLDEADKIAHVLMASLHMPNFMLDSERKATEKAANILFEQLEYTIRTNSKGERVELKPAAKRVSPDCEHPGLFARMEDKPGDLRHCHHCGRDIPIEQL